MQQLHRHISDRDAMRRSLPAAKRPSCASRPLPSHPQQRHRPCLLVVCKAKRGSGSGKGAQTAVSPKGFGEQAPVKQVVLQDGSSFVDNSLPVYRVYYRPNYLPPKYYGAVDVQRTEDGSLGLVLAADVILGDLLAVCTPIAYLEGSFGVPPELEDLQALMLEQPPTPEQRRIIELIRPATVVKASADASAAGAPAQPVIKAGVGVLDETYWQERQDQLLGGQKPLSAKQLMEVLQACAYSEEFHDPAAMQVRHQRPLGFTGLWQEYAAMAHSCIPNASVVVVKDRMLIHSNGDGEAGQRVTFNKIGRYVATPLAVRAAQLQEQLGTTCGCARCSAEAGLPADVAGLIADAYAKVEGQWARSYQEGLMAGDGDALAALQEEMVFDLESVEEALAEPQLGLSQQQQLWLRAALYDAYDQVWQLEELLNEEPAHDRLNACLQLIKVFAKGSESHVALAMRLDERLEVASERLLRGAKGKRRTAAAERRLLRAVEAMTAEAEQAAMEYFEAVFSRYGLIPEGLLPQLRQGQQLFYEGLQELSSMRGEGATQGSNSDSGNSDGAASSSGSDGSESSGGSRSKELSINGVRVTVVDRVGVEDDAPGTSSGQGDGDGGAGQTVQVINAGGVRMQLVQDNSTNSSGSGFDTEARAGTSSSSSSTSSSSESSSGSRNGVDAGESGEAEDAGFDADSIDLEEFLGGVLDNDVELDFGEEGEEGEERGGGEDDDEAFDAMELLGEAEDGMPADGEEGEEGEGLVDDEALAAAVRAFQQQQQEQRQRGAGTA